MVSKIKKILVSQPKPDPEKSPYTQLINKHKIKIDFFKFFKVVGVSVKEFRQQRINIPDYTAIILTSKNAVDHFFRISEEMRISISDDVKYFCASETIALYLQKYVIYRKRKVFCGKTNICDLMEIIKKHKEEKFLLPCTENHKIEIPCLLEQEAIKFDKAVIYRTVSENLSKMELEKYDMMAFFSPSGIISLFDNLPDFKQDNKIIAVFGNTTLEEAQKYGLNPQIIAPTKETPSMTMAIDSFIENLNKNKNNCSKTKSEDKPDVTPVKAIIPAKKSTKK